MGKNVKKKKIDYGGMADEVISTVENEYTDTSTQEQTPPKKESAPTPTRTDTPKYAPAHLPTVGKGERKTERLQLLVRPSTKSRLAEYARDHGTSSNEVVQRLLDDLLDDAGY
jgi:hypothetical protein